MGSLLYVEVLVTMFVIMDPVGNVPIFLSVTRRLDERARHRAALLAVLTATFVIVAFALVGQQVLAYLNVSVPALQAAGGLLLLLVALELLTGTGSVGRGEPEEGDHVAVAMVPLGTPLLAGPGVLGIMGGALLLVLAVASGLPGRILPGGDEPPPAQLEVGSCFVVDANGRVLPERCTARNDGTVLAEVMEPEACELLAGDARATFTQVGPRTFCLADR